MNYQPLYTILFNAITDALRLMEEENFGLAKACLMQAQQQTEERYMEGASSDS